MDISSPAQPTLSKVTTVNNIIGPRDLAVDSNASMAYLLDSNGALMSMDLMPGIPCGNMFNFTLGELRKWQNTSKFKDQQVLKSSKQFHLRRKAAAQNSTGVEWELTVTKISKHVEINSTVIYTVHKFVVCSRVKSSEMGASCCVKKESPLPTDHATQQKLVRVLSEL